MPKVILIAALSADGYISQSKDQVSTSWTNKEDKKFFVETTKKIGTVIMGSATYETFNTPLKERRNIVLSKTKTYPGVEMSRESPKELLERLENEGVASVALCGGASVYTSFLKEGLVDTLYLTVGNILFGQGITLCTEILETHLKLVSSTTLGENTVLLEYSVIKTI